MPASVFLLPFQIFQERFFKRKDLRSPFVQNATIFQDIVIRCVRYAFAYIPARIGRVFFSKGVAYPFFRFRLLRHGYLRPPIRFDEVKRSGFRGLWIAFDRLEKPDIVIYYCHGMVIMKPVGSPLYVEEGTLIPSQVVASQWVPAISISNFSWLGCRC